MLELHCAHVLILFSPFLVYGIYTAVEDFEFWWCLYPSLFAVLMSILIHKYKWIFRYVIPSAILFLYIVYTSGNIGLMEVKNDWMDFLIFISLSKWLYVIYIKIRVTILLLILKIQKYNLKKICLFIVLCLLHALLFVNICCKVAENAILLSDTIMPFLKFSQIYYEAKIPFRHYYGDYMYLRKNEQLHSFEFVDPLDNRNIYVESSFVTLNEYERFPRCLHNAYRVLGEDVELSCNFEFKTVHIQGGHEWSHTINLFSMKHEWRRKGKKIRKTNRYEMRNNFDSSTNKFDFRLRITDLQQHDFDSVIDLWMYQKIPVNDTEMVIRLKAAMFSIHLDKLKISYVQVPTGHVALFRHISVNTFSDFDDIVLRQDIESFQNTQFDISNACSDSGNGCNPILSFLQKFFPPFNRIHNDPYVSLGGRLTYSSVFCVCEATYGIHTFSILKYQYSPHTKNRFILKEFQLPYKIVVLPIGLTRFSDQSYQELRNEVSELLSQNKDWTRSWKFFKNDFWNSMIWNFIQYVALFCLHLDVVILSIVIIKIYNYLFIQTFARKLLKPLSPFEGDIPVNTFGNFNIPHAIRHDSVIINAEEDMEFVENQILPIIQRRGLRFYVLCRDVIPGQTEIQAYAEAVESSRTFIVIASDHFIDDKVLNDLVLSRMLIPMMYKNMLQNARILVVKMNDIVIPNIVRLNHRIMCWSRHNSTEENEHNLNRELDVLFPSDTSETCCIL